MKLFSTVASAALLSAGLMQAANAQDIPSRQIGSLDVNAVTTAPLQVARSFELDATPAEIFATISDNGNWVSWFDVIGGVSADAGARTFTFADGSGSLTENIVAFDDPAVFAWSMTSENPLGLQDHLGVLHVIPDNEDGEGSLVTVSAFYNHPNLDGIMPVTSGSGAAISAGLIEAHGGNVHQDVSGTSAITITTTRHIDAPIDDVWSVAVEDFGDVAEWNSLISEASLFGGTDTSNDGLLGVSRKCFIPSFGSEVQERVVEIDRDAGRFVYEVLAGLPPFASNGRNVWTFEEAADGGTIASTTVTMDIAEDTPGMQRGLTKANFAQVVTLTLDELQYFIEQGEPHPREIASRG